MHKLKKVTLFIVSFITITVVIAMLFSSPIAKYLILKHARNLTGRQITMDWVYINPLTGTVNISNLKIYELKSDSIFFSSKGISANISMLKLLFKNYEIKKLTINKPRLSIIQNEKSFNIDDLIEKFSSKEITDSIHPAKHLSILNVRIIDGEVSYREQQIPINYFIKKVTLISSGIRWDTDSVNFKFSFLPGVGNGDIKGDLTFNLKSYDYRIAVLAHKFDLDIIEQYLKDLMNYGSFSANIDANIKAKGNINDQEDLSATGQIAINDFHLGKNPKDDFLSFDKLALSITELDPKNHKYLLDSISFSHPYLKYEIYDHLDNVQRMFGIHGANITTANANTGTFNLIIALARYAKVLANSFFRSDYKINRLRIYDGDIKFNDYSTSEKFALELNPLTVNADSIDKDRKRVNVSLESPIKPYGNVSVGVRFNPKDSSDFDLQYHFRKLPVTMFNPYIISFTSFPLDRGTLEFNGSWIVRNGLIQSTNHLVIIDSRTSKRIRNKDTKWIPVPLIMTFIRERGNVIDYEIPITGNLKDPKFHLHYVVFDLLRNVFLKAPTTPYRLQVKNVEAEIEKSISLKWETRQTAILPDQGKFIEKMGDFLLKNTDATIEVYPYQFARKEKEYILFFEAKKKYFMALNNKSSGSFSTQDSDKVDKMSVKDSLFTLYLNKHEKDSLVFTVQEKCTGIIDSAFVNSKFDQLNKERENAFIHYFKIKGVDNRVKILKGEQVVPYNGFSFYKIEYKGEFPESLMKAYHNMNELNNEAPRKKFKQERNSINPLVQSKL